jgi:hypothetical protein
MQISRYSYNLTSVLSCCHTPNGNKNLDWNEIIFYQGLFSQKLSNYHISLWRKVFFSFLTNFFFIHIKGVINMVFGGFPKIIRNKTFYFHTKKKITLFFFYLVLALESISGVKSWLFGQTTLNIIFSQKLSNYHISPWRKVFSFLTNFFFIHIKVAYCCEGSPNKTE